MKNKNLTIIFVVLLILVGSGAFFAGMKYQQSQRGNLARGQFGGQLGTSRFGNSGTRPVSGQIISSDSKSITVKLANGSSVIALLSSATVINKAASATAADLKTGEKVLIVGTQNSDGSITASNVQVGLEFGRGMMATPSTSQ